MDQITYQDGINRARSSLKDSYGNPVEYDTLEAVDAKKPSNNKNDPNKFIIPGYASGILQPHEVPTRSFSETPGKIDDDRIHFIDPLNNQYPKDDKTFQTPSPSLSTPLGNDNANNLQPQTAINIPRPNIDLPETPQTPIDDPLDHVPLNPPRDNAGGSPSFALEAPNGNQNTQQLPLTQDLIPPQIPNEGQSVFIPRPNLDVQETPIDNSNGPINQGLLPPTDSSSNFNSNSNNNGQSFSNPNQAGPVVFTDVLFAPKPSNGLVPPKDSLPNDVQPQGATQTVAAPTVATPNKFSGSFGGAPGVLGGAVDRVVNTVQNKLSGTTTIPHFANIGTTVGNKFSGSFGGSSGVLGGRPASHQIPVTVVQDPYYRPSPTQNTFTQPPKSSNNKYQGNFGGSPGVLVSNNQGGNVTPIQAPLTVQDQSVAPTVATDRFSGSFDGTQAVSGSSKEPILSQAPTTQTITQLPSLNNPYQSTTKESTVQRYTGQFGGAPGILLPYDNNSKN